MYCTGFHMLVDDYWLMHWRVGWCVESTCWLTFTDWCIAILFVVLDRHVFWRLLTDALTCWLVFWIDMLVDVYWLMHWCVGWCVESIYLLMFTDWCLAVLVGLLDQQVSWCWVDMLIFYLFYSMQLLWTNCWILL